LQASPSKKFQPSKNVIGFCTAVFIEVLGTVVTVDDDIVKRILPFVSSGLQHGINGVSDHKVRLFSCIKTDFDICRHQPSFSNFCKDLLASWQCTYSEMGRPFEMNLHFPLHVKIR
jgi:hypothetical protein